MIAYLALLDIQDVIRGPGYQVHVVGDEQQAPARRGELSEQRDGQAHVVPVQAACGLIEHQKVPSALRRDGQQQALLLPA